MLLFLWVVTLATLISVAVVVRADVLVYDLGNELRDQFNDLPARFGPQFPLEGLRAYPVMASDVFGCGDIQPPPPTTSDQGFVVLMQRNNCTFFEKVLNAQQAGYAAAIVYNLDSDDLVEMSGDSGSTEDVKIPSMFIGYYSALEINDTFIYDARMKDFKLLLNRNLPFNINTHLLWPLVAIVFLVFASMIIVTVVKCLRHRNRMQRERLPHRELRKLPVIKFQQATCRYETCSICLDDYEEGERLRVLPCQHTYHTKCVDPWLTKGKRNCPMCKRKVRLQARQRPRRRRSNDSDSGSSSSSGNSVVDDTRPLLTGGRGNTNTNGTFPTGENVGIAPIETEQSRNFVTALLRSLFSSSTGVDEGSTGSRPVVNERVNMLPATVSAVVDMSPSPPSPSVPPPPAVFQAPAVALGGVLITTPISSPLRRAAVAQVRSRSLERGSSGSGGTPRIGVAALPNVDFQGVPGAFLPPPPSQQPHPSIHHQPSQVARSQQQQQQRSNSRHNRRRRRGEGGGGGGGRGTEDV